MRAGETFSVQGRLKNGRVGSKRSGHGTLLGRPVESRALSYALTSSQQSPGFSLGRLHPPEPAIAKGDLQVADSAVHSTEAGDDPSRRDFIHIAAIAAAGGAAASIAWPLISQMNPSADTLALASVEYDLTKIETGQQVTINWRGKPLFIRNRTQAQIDAAVRDDSAVLKDPQADAQRHKEGKAQWLVLIGSCTHLGCVPTVGGGDYGGWFCPCHGSTYDTSGRIRKGPAPTNLVVPDYAFLSDTKVKIG